MAHDVFISYSSEDKLTADAVCNTLESRGIRCWIAPRDVLPGEDYPSALVRAINEARVLVLVFSSHANESPHVARELERAANREIPILPLRIENVMPSPSMEYFISRTHWLDALTPPLRKHLERLADTAKLLISRGDPDEAKVAPSAEPPARSAVRPLDWARIPGVRLSAIAIVATVVVIVGAIVALSSGGGDGEPATLATQPTEGVTASAQGVNSTLTTTPAVRSSPPRTENASAVGGAPLFGQADGYAIQAAPDCIAPGGRVEISWTAHDQQTGDIVVLFPVAARNDEYSSYEWLYINTIGGRLIYPASSAPGDYEARLLRAGSHLAASEPIKVESGCPDSASTPNAEGYTASASPACVSPGGRIEASWAGADHMTGDIVALFPVTGRNDHYSSYEWEYVSTASGTLIFPAASSTGQYEARLLRSGTHLAVSEPITVGGSC